MPLTNIETVRLLTGLTTTDVGDDEIDALLELNEDVVKLAAADALESYASTLVDVTSDDITLNGTRRSTLLRAHAQRLRERADADAEDAAFTFETVSSGAYRPELTEPVTYYAGPGWPG